MKNIAIILIGLIGICDSLVTASLQKSINTMQDQIRAIQDIQNGQDLHLQFVDSDHTKLSRDLVNLRQDLDNLRYRNQAEER